MLSIAICRFGSRRGASPILSTIEIADESSNLVGREAETAALADLLDRLAVHGRGGTVHLTGDGGIGKSALLRWLQRGATARGVDTLFARGDEVAIRHPFSTLSQLLDDDSPIDTGAVEGNEANRVYATVVAFAEALQRRSQAAPILAIIDDLQWADTSTLLALPLLQRDLVDHPVLFAFASRPHELPPEADSIRRALESADAHAFALEGLAPADQRRLVRDIAGAEPSDRLVERLAGADGNPFLIIYALSASRDALTLIDGRAELEGTSALQTAAQLPMLPRLRHEERTALECSAVLGRLADLDVLAAMLDVPVDEVWRRLEPAVAARVLVDDGRALVFRHDLLRDAVLASLPSPYRRDLRRRAAGVLHDRGAPAEVVARLCEDALRPGDRKLIEYLVAAARQVLYVAPHTALAWLQLAHECSAGAGVEIEELVSLRVEALFFSGRSREAITVAQLALHGRVESPVERTRLEAIVAASLFVEGRHREAAEAFEQLFAHGDRRGTDLGVAGADAAMSYILSSDLERAGRQCDAVLAQRLSTPARAYAMAVRGMLRALKGELRQGIEDCELAVALAEAHHDDSAHRNLPYYFLAQTLVWADHHERARAMIADGQAVATRLGFGWHQPPYHVALAESHLRLLELDEAEATAEAGLIYAADTSTTLEDARLHALLAEVALERGDLDAATAHLDNCDTAQRRAGGHGADHLFRLLSRLAAHRGDLAAAASHMRMLWDAVARLGAGLRLWELAPEAITLARQTGDVDWAHDVRARLRELDSPLRPWVLVYIDDVVSEATHAVLPDLVPQDRALVERLMGAGQPGRRPAEQKAGGWRSQLTEAEARVVERVARGMTNAEIAAELCISRRTVESHLYHVYPKVGVTSRIALAVLAGR